MPSTVFSCFNAYGFALNDVPCWFVAKECSEYIDNIMERYFGQPDNENFTIKLFDDKRFGIKSNEIFYSFH